MDPSYIVIDEVVGIWLTVLLLMVFYPPSCKLYGLGFIVFRLFDIFKPWPIGLIDKGFAEHRCLAALGIMTDDVLAAIMATVLVASLFAKFPQL